MAKSKHLTEILSLGKTLTKLFADYCRTDLTVAWMAHYLAEQIKAAESETNAAKKKTLQKECAEVILGLWEKRNKFPDSVRPLSGLKHAVEIIKALKDEENQQLFYRGFRGFESDSIWGNYMHSLRVAVEDSMKIAMCGAVNQQARIRNREFKQKSNFLTENERVIMEFLDKELDKSDSLFKIVYKIEGQEQPEEHKTKPELMKRVTSKLRELLDKQYAALDVLEQQLKNDKNSRKK